MNFGIHRLIGATVFADLRRITAERRIFAKSPEIGDVGEQETGD